VDPEGTPAFRGWLDARDVQTRRMCEKALAAGLKQRARRRRREVRVAKVVAPLWTQRRLPLSVASRFVKRPLVLLLENEHNDGKFLRVFTRHRRDFDIDRLTQRGLLALDSKGGTGETRKWLEEHGNDPEIALRHWVMCDSDARRGWSRSPDGSLPAEVGDGARALAKHCHGCAIPVPLAEAVRKKPGTDPEALARWFWLMAYSGTSAGLPKILKTLDYMTGDTAEPPPLAVSLGRELPPLPKRFDFRTARCRALSLRLAARAGGGAEAILAEHGARAMQHLVLDWRAAEREDFASPANRIFVSPEDASQERASIAQACAEHRQRFSSPNASPEPAGTLVRHCIPGSAALAFDDESYPSFMELRREALVAMEEAFVRNLGLLQP
jgi:hypothetical protein